MDKPLSLIVPRRNFLVRAFGLTAAGATMAVPVLAVETPVERLNMHLKGVKIAFEEMFPGRQFRIAGEGLTAPDYQRLLEAAHRREMSFPFALIHDASRNDYG
ncbi:MULTISPECIES: hypothetical protein [unclassified Beijerinckia]|uniref:hypothetical protein n=1 Tax=unclassified Beijerinckia TaxID=2638183 RepID=UPI000895C668|nr:MULTISPECIES: hypothetical protein [unclassified Beijerinckia]MDH7797487.1 hypothetical protein [Beijerinckia sp. GAS462]SEC87613.1 hypothetical protein SAMN05443249_3782 [Beijerinckia sp. 28-YEA-48]